MSAREELFVKGRLIETKVKRDYQAINSTETQTKTSQQQSKDKMVHEDALLASSLVCEYGFTF